MYPMLIIFTCRTTIMANTYTNSFIHNIGLNEENSLSHLLDKISPEIENETDLLEHSKYYNDLRNQTYLKALLLNYGENRAHTKNTYLEMSIVCHYMALMI